MEELGFLSPFTGAAFATRKQASLPKPELPGKQLAKTQGHRAGYSRAGCSTEQGAPEQGAQWSTWHRQKAGYSAGGKPAVPAEVQKGDRDRSIVLYLGSVTELG